MVGGYCVDGVVGMGLILRVLCIGRVDFDTQVQVMSYISFWLVQVDQWVGIRWGLVIELLVWF